MASICQNPRLEEKFFQEFDKFRDDGSSPSVIIIEIIVPLSNFKVSIFAFVAIVKPIDFVTIKFKTQGHYYFAGNHNFN